MEKSSINFETTDPWLSAVEAANLVGISKNTFRRGVAAGRFPKPIRLGGLVRWPRSEILDALEALKASR